MIAGTIAGCGGGGSKATESTTGAKQESAQEKGTVQAPEKEAASG